MSFLDLLQDLGDKLGILESASGLAAQPASKIQTRTVTLAELTTEIRSEEVRALADLPAELAVPFEKIYDTAGIQRPANGWNVDRLKQFLLTDAFKNKDRTVVQTAILNILKTENATVEDVVKDAMARDKALDAFEAFVQKKMNDRMAVRERKAAELESQISAIRSELDELKERGAADDAKWKEWRRQKRAQERELAWAVGYLIDRQVITTDDEEP
ncbi:MAG TPA: hypothetical protein VE398_02720 [Acidobacteriota bacterium]|nr:hypothetical protein [Acidobacteriota bacterium]